MKFSVVLPGLALAALLALVCLGALAQTPPALYEGADREAKLIAGAKSEGALTIYVSMAEPDVRRLLNAFEKRYGIKTTLFRAGKDQVLQRVINEARAGRNTVDFIHNPSPEMEALHREKLLQEVRSPALRNVIPAAIPAHREWVGGRMYIFVQLYNTTKVKPEELPKTFNDLLDPRWKGRLGIEAKEGEWFATLAKEMGEERTVKLFRDISSTNGLMVRNGNSLLKNLVVAGDVPFAVTMYSYLADQAKREGAPLNYVALDPVVAYTDGMAVAKNAPHPNAAVLFYDFIFTEGEQLLTEIQHVTTSRRNEPMLSKMKLKYMDVPSILDGYDKWDRLYQDVVRGR